MQASKQCFKYSKGLLTLFKVYFGYLTSSNIGFVCCYCFFSPISPDSKVDNPNMTGKSNKTESCCKISWFLQNISQWNAIDSMHLKKRKMNSIFSPS